VGAAVAALLYVLVARTRVGMLVRAGASNREMALAMGVDIRRLFTLLFGVGAGLCAVAGALLGPLLAVQVGMGENILILAFVCHRHRRHRLDPRRARGGGAGGAGRHHRARFPAAALRALLPAAGGERGGPGACVGARVSADGRGAVLQAARPLSRARLACSATRPSRLSSSRSPSRSWSPRRTTSRSRARILVYALAATSLNLVLGYGGMISFGHAAFVGNWRLRVEHLHRGGIASAWIGWPAAVAASALAALVIGAVSLRTRGVYFIMITLAFAQMMFFLVNSMKAYGGDEGLTLPARATGLGIDLGSDLGFYYVALRRARRRGLPASTGCRAPRFGRVIQAIRENEARAEAIGFPVYRYKLACFVIAGAVGGLAACCSRAMANTSTRTCSIGPSQARSW